MSRPKKQVPLTVAELFYITSKAGVSTVEQIATDIGKTIEEVAPHVPTQVPQVEESPKVTTVRDLMGRTTKEGRNNRGITIMTKTASEVGDSTRASRKSRPNEDCIHKPLGD